MKPSRFELMTFGIVVIAFVIAASLLSTPPSAHALHASPINNAPNLLYLPLVFNSISHVAISIQNFAYNPQAITVTVGTQITWTNNEAFPINHTVTSGAVPTPDGKFDSYPVFLAPGDSFAFTFTTAGTYPYFCRVHLAAMTGTITVVP